jgi:hypothetical protein
VGQLWGQPCNFYARAGSKRATTTARPPCCRRARPHPPTPPVRGGKASYVQPYTFSNFFVNESHCGVIEGGAQMALPPGLGVLRGEGALPLDQPAFARMLSWLKKVRGRGGELFLHW